MYFNKNLKHLRRKNNRQTQENLAKCLGLTRSVISSYEDGRAEPNIATLTRMSEYFNVSIDNLTNLDLANVDQEQIALKKKLQTYASAQHLQIQTVTSEEPHVRNLVHMVPVKASAGYTAGFSDPDYLSELPGYHLPFLSSTAQYRAFEISGDSMLPLRDGSIVIGEFVENFSSLRDGEVCVVVSKNEGIVLKKVYNFKDSRGTFLLKSSNILYSPYEIETDEVLEFWRYTAYISRSFPEEPDTAQDLKNAFARMESEIQTLKMSQIGAE